MTPELTIIEEHTDEGVEWGLSTAGPNPPSAEFVRVASKEAAYRIKAEYDRGNITPFLDAALAIMGEQVDA